MPLEDYLLPNERILYQSNFDILYSGKRYTVLLTDIRLVLFASRGVLFKSDDVVTEAIRNIQGIKYREKGMFFKTCSIEVLSDSKIVLTGNKASMKTLYQRLLPFLSPELRMNQSYTFPPAPAYSPPTSSIDTSSSHYCPSCGIELFPNEKFCHNCGKQLP